MRGRYLRYGKVNEAWYGKVVWNLGARARIRMRMGNLDEDLG